MRRVVVGSALFAVTAMVWACTIWNDASLSEISDMKMAR